MNAADRMPSGAVARMTHALPDLRRQPHALLVRKRALPMQVTFAGADGTCETLEGAVNYRTGDALLTGTRGERWPVERERFLSTYHPIPPTHAGEPGAYAKRPHTVLALQLAQPLAVPVASSAGVLQARASDWLLQYAPDEYGVVSNEVFLEIYERC